jgi:hypothetical protein
MTHIEILGRLLAMPALLAHAAEALAPEQWRMRGPDAGFALTEQAWHLADLEREGYGARITRLLTEEAPFLPDFDGDRVAREREYRDADLALGIRLFATARARNAERLRTLSEPAHLRHGVQDQVGPVTLGQIPLMMARHDQGHALEIAELLAHFGAAAATVAALRAHASAALPSVPDAPSSHPAAA